MSDTMSNEEKKFLINALWDALIETRWTADTLIAFGKAIHSKKRLKEMDDSVFNQIFGPLKDVSENLQKKLSAWASQLPVEKPSEKKAEVVQEKQNTDKEPA